MTKIKYELYNTLSGEIEQTRIIELTEMELTIYLEKLNYTPYDYEGKTYHVNDKQWKKVVTILS